jgi:hypothetical protein
MPSTDHYFATSARVFLSFFLLTITTRISHIELCLYPCHHILVNVALTLLCL